MLRSLLPITLLLALASALLAQDRFANVEIKTTQVADDIYMLEGAGGNIGLCVGEDGPFVIDDQFAPLAEKILAAIGEVTDRPVKYVLNTHHHGDHTGGNEAMSGAGATIVAHENVRKRLAEAGGEKGSLPVITFTESVTFHWNGHEIVVGHVPPSHTDGDSIINFKSANVVHMGDLFFNGAYPFVDLAGGGDLDGYIAVQEAVLAEIDDDTKIIPGHGPLAAKADLRKMNDLLKDVRTRIQSAIDDGMTLEETLEADPLADLSEQYGGGFINGERMTRIAYESLTR